MKNSTHETRNMSFDPDLAKPKLKGKKRRPKRDGCGSSLVVNNTKYPSDVNITIHENTTPPGPEDTTSSEPKDTTPPGPEDTTPSEPKDTTPPGPEDTTPSEPEDTTPSDHEDTTPPGPGEGATSSHADKAIEDIVDRIIKNVSIDTIEDRNNDALIELAEILAKDAANKYPRKVGNEVLAGIAAAITAGLIGRKASLTGDERTPLPGEEPPATKK